MAVQCRNGCAISAAFHQQSVSMVVQSNTGRNIIHCRFMNSEKPLMQRIICENDVGLILDVLGQPLIVLASEKLADSHFDLVQYCMHDVEKNAQRGFASGLKR